MSQAPASPRQKIQRLPVHGVLLLDKPLGLSSNDALGKAKWLLRALKAGHTGTLDPLATGLLPLCFGEATKFSQDLLEAEKEYLAEVKLGQTTTTGDAEGEVLQTRAVNFSASQLTAVMARFTGEISQVPPMYSALKKDGKPLYEYARAGETIERAARQVVIRELELHSQTADTLQIRVACSKGTYIRTLAEDIGEALGCGAHLTALRRTRVGDLTLQGAVTLVQLEAAPESSRTALLAPVDALLQKFQKLGLSADDSLRFSHGQRLKLASADYAENSLLRIYSAQDALLGVARWQAGVLQPERLVKF